jgi:hypothetical protein
MASIRLQEVRSAIYNFDYSFDTLCVIRAGNSNLVCEVRRPVIHSSTFVRTVDRSAVRTEEPWAVSPFLGEADLLRSTERPNGPRTSESRPPDSTDGPGATTV